MAAVQACQSITKKKCFCWYTRFLFVHEVMKQDTTCYFVSFERLVYFLNFGARLFFFLRSSSASWLRLHTWCRDINLVLIPIFGCLPLQLKTDTHHPMALPPWVAQVLNLLSQNALQWWYMRWCTSPRKSLNLFNCPGCWKMTNHTKTAPCLIYSSGVKTVGPQMNIYLFCQSWRPKTSSVIIRELICIRLYLL